MQSVSAVGAQQTPIVLKKTDLQPLTAIFDLQPLTAGQHLPHNNGTTLHGDDCILWDRDINKLRTEEPKDRDCDGIPALFRRDRNGD
jgi:hypothetical protein